MKKGKLKSGTYLGFMFALPAVIYMLIFIGYPMIENLMLSLKNVDVYTFAQPDQQQFVGIANYLELFTDTGSIMTNPLAIR